MRHVATRVVVVCVVGFSLWPVASPAAPILRTFAQVYPGDFSGLSLQSDLDTLNNANSASSLSSNASMSTTFGVASFSGSSSAVATFGSLGAGASVTIDNYQARNFTEPCPGNPSISCTTDPVRASAFFIDTLIIGGGVGDDVLQLTFDVDGTRSLTFQSNGILQGPGAQGTLGVGPTLSNTFSWLSVGFNTGGVFTTSAIPFTYGVPLQIAVRLDAFVSPFDINNVPGTYDLTGTADYLHTAILSGMKVFTDSGLSTQVSAFTVSAESGARYPVPEPSLLALAAVAALGCFTRERRLRRRADQL